MRRRKLDSSSFTWKLSKKLFTKTQAYLDLIDTLNVIPDAGLFPLSAYYTAASIYRCEVPKDITDGGYLISGKQKDEYTRFANILISNKCYMNAKMICDRILDSNDDRPTDFAFSDETIRVLDQWLKYQGRYNTPPELEETLILTLKANAMTSNGEFDAYPQINRIQDKFFSNDAIREYTGKSIEHDKRLLKIMYYILCCQLGISPGSISSLNELKNISYKNVINISDTTLAAIPDIPQMAAICSLNKKTTPFLTSPRGVTYLPHLGDIQTQNAIQNMATFYKTASNARV